MSTKNIENKTKKNGSQKKHSKLKETILIIAIVILLVAIDVALIFAVLHFYDNHDHTDTPGTTTPQDSFKYPEYKNSSDADTEGLYYDTAKTGSGTDIDMQKVSKEIDAYKYSDFAKTDKQSDFAVIRVQDYGDIVVALREDIAPKTVANFKKLVASGFYSNTTFHRVRKDFMIQGGSKSAAGETKNTETINGEFTQNGHENNLLHEKGILSMARASGRDTATSGFFIMHGDSKDLDGLYASFGYVLAGYDVVNKIAACEVSKSSELNEISVPKSTIVIKEVFFVEPIKGAGIGVADNTDQQTEDYQIIIVDSEGKGIKGVTFKMTNTDTNQSSAVRITDENGRAVFKMQSAPYKLEIISAAGYDFDTDGYPIQKEVTKYSVTLEKKA